MYALQTMLLHSISLYPINLSLIINEDVVTSYLVHSRLTYLLRKARKVNDVVVE